MAQCGYDTGSMYGCEPACSARATHSMTYGNGSHGPFTVALCERHVGSMRGRVWPDRSEVTVIA